MKRVIRRGVFETNSSSMHSIVITRRDGFTSENQKEDYFYASCYKGKLRIWSIDDLTFDRYPFKTLTTAEEKLCYAIANKIPPLGEFGVEDSDNETLQQEVKKFDRLASVIFESHGCTGIEYPTDFGGGLFYGHVDGQSYTLFDRFLEDENISVKEFICNPKYVVVIDGDEYRIFDKMKDAGLIDHNNIVKEFD